MNNINDWYIRMLHSHSVSSISNIWDIQMNIEYWVVIKHRLTHIRRINEDIIILGLYNEISIMVNILLSSRTYSYTGNVIVLDKGWVTGILTNKKTYREYAMGYIYTKGAITDKQIEWYKIHRMNIESWLLSKHHKLPSVRLVIDSSRSVVARSEAKLCGLITIGIGDNDLSYSYLDYNRNGTYGSIVSQLRILLIRINNNVNVEYPCVNDISIMLECNDVYINETLSI